MGLGGRAGFRRALLLTAATLLVIGGVLLTLSAPGSSPVSNKADAYGSAPVASKPTNPKTKTECTKYYGTIATAESLECQAQATRYAALKRCSHKRGAAQRACKKAAAKGYAKSLAKIAAQRKAEKACSEANSAGQSQLNPEDPEYSQKVGQLAATLQACLAKARA
jgi:hypothetical protein